MMFHRLHAFKDYVHYYLRTWEYLRRNLNEPHAAAIFPTIIQIGTQNRCNGRCRMCPYPDTVAKQPRQEMSPEMVRDILSEIAEWNIGNARKHAGMVVFTLQNEPLLDARLPEFISLARQKLAPAWDIEITTNGVLLEGDMARRIANAAPWAVSVSVNGFSQTAYDQTMPGFLVEKVFSNIEEFLKIKHQDTKLMIRYVKQQANDMEFVALKRYWNARGVAVIGYGANDRLGDVKDYEGIKSRASGVFGDFLRKQIGSRVFDACPFLFCQANVLPSGKLLMCCHDYRHSSVMGDAVCLGNSREQQRQLFSTYNSPEYVQLRREAHAGKYSGVCLRCSLFKSHIWL